MLNLSAHVSGKVFLFFKTKKVISYKKLKRELLECLRGEIMNDSNK